MELKKKVWISVNTVRSAAGLRDNISPSLYGKFGFRTNFFAYVVKDETGHENKR